MDVRVPPRDVDSGHADILRAVMSIQRVMALSPFFESLASSVKIPNEHTIAQALRTQSCAVEVRMVLTAPAHGNWFGRGDRGEVGGYEVQRTVWSTDFLNSLMQKTQADWEACTIYVVRI